MTSINIIKNEKLYFEKTIHKLSYALLFILCSGNISKLWQALKLTMNCCLYMSSRPFNLKVVLKMYGPYWIFSAAAKEPCYNENTKVKAVC